MAEQWENAKRSRSSRRKATRLVLYQYDACPFCARVRQYLAGAGIELPTKDTQRDAAAFRELVMGGGRATVPCLRIETDSGVRWLYESGDIIEYLGAGARLFDAAGGGS